MDDFDIAQSKNGETTVIDFAALIVIYEFLKNLKQVVEAFRWYRTEFRRWVRYEVRAALQEIALDDSEGPGRPKSGRAKRSQRRRTPALGRRFREAD